MFFDNAVDSKITCPERSLPVAKFYNILSPNEVDENGDSCISIDEFIAHLNNKVNVAYAEINTHFLTCKPFNKVEVSSYTDSAFAEVKDTLVKGFKVFIENKEASKVQLELNRSDVDLMIAEHKLSLLTYSEKGASGIGIHFKTDSGEITYVRKDSGAEKADIRLGDRITAIEGRGFETIKDPVAMLLGECNVPVNITIYRPVTFFGFDIGDTWLMQMFKVPTSEYGVHKYFANRLAFN